MTTNDTETDTISFDEYQAFTDTTAQYNEGVYAYVPARTAEGDIIEYELKGLQMPWIYPVIALGEEAGEVLGKVAKFIRKSSDDEDGLRELVKKELGDVLYQVAQTARQFHLGLEEIALDNKAKLEGRVERGTIIGEGDER